MKKINAMIAISYEKLQEVQNKSPKLDKYLKSFTNLLLENTNYYSPDTRNRYSFERISDDRKKLFEREIPCIMDEDVEAGKPTNVVLFKDTTLRPTEKIELLKWAADRAYYQRSYPEIRQKYLSICEKLQEENLTYLRMETFNEIWVEEKESGENEINATTIGSLMLKNISTIDLTGDEYDFTGKRWSNNRINCLSSSHINQIASIETNSKLKMYDLTNLYRGSTPTNYKIVEKSPAAFKKGYKIVLAKIKTKAFINGVEEDFYKTIWITNVPLNNVTKYRKCKAFFSSFEKKSEIYSGSYFFDREAYQNKLKERFGKNNVYTNLTERIFGETDQVYNKVKMHDTVQETTFNPLNLSIFGQLKKAKNNKKYISYQKTKQKLQEFEGKVASLSNSQETIERRKNRIQRNLERLEEEIRNTRTSLAEVKKEEKEIETNLPGYIEAKEQLSTKIKKLEKDYNEYISSLNIENVEQDNYSASFKKQGIVIDKVVYSKNNQDIELKENSKIILESLKAESNTVLKEITFRIIRPVTIYVDRAEKGESCKKVAGGPYIVNVTPNDLNIGLLSSASVFGFSSKNNTVWIHPHTAGFGVNLSTVENFYNQLLKSNMRRACLGEAGPALYSAFKAKDIRQIIFAAMSWITNANSSDAWGKHYKFFPKIEEIESNDFEVTKQFINRQTMEEKLMDKEAVFDLFADSLVEEVEQIETVQENNQPQEAENQEERPQMTFQLRRAGVQGYQPLYTNQN